MMIRTNKRVLSKKGILNILYSKDNTIEVSKIDKIYYPYAVMVYEIKMKNPKSLMNRKIMCIMDMTTGQGAIGDVDPKLVEIETDDILVLEGRVTDEELRKKSHDFVFKTILGKVKVLYVPEIILEKTYYFHKLFYVIQCKDPGGIEYYLLADSMDANFTELAC